MCEFNGNNGKLCDQFNNCKHCYDRSFASHPKSNYLLDKTLNPRMIFAKSNKKYWFVCNICKHVFETTLDAITNAKRWCMYCANKSLCDDDGCNTCYSKSCASNRLMLECMLQNNTRLILKSSHILCRFECPYCMHIFYASPNHISQGRWCGYCSVPAKLLCSDDKCNYCLNKSFASHSMAIYLKGGLEEARKLRKQTNKKKEFICPYCNNIYEASPNSIATGGNWCNCRKNKTETKLLEFLQEEYKNIQKQKRFIDYKSAIYDFYLPEYNIIIELDGPQHFENTSNWQSSDITQQKDFEKMTFLKRKTSI